MFVCGKPTLSKRRADLGDADIWHRRDICLYVVDQYWANDEQIWGMLKYDTSETYVCTRYYLLYSTRLYSTLLYPTRLYSTLLHYTLLNSTWRYSTRLCFTISDSTKSDPIWCDIRSDLIRSKPSRHQIWSDPNPPISTSFVPSNSFVIAMNSNRDFKLQSSRKYWWRVLISIQKCNIFRSTGPRSKRDRDIH